MANADDADAANAANAANALAPAPPFPSPGALRSWLHQRGVPTDAWGSSSAKSVEDLFEEINAGESALFEHTAAAAADAAATLKATALRLVSVVSLVLSAPPHSSSSLLVLAEASQVLPDGRVRRRGLLPLSEKMREGEGWEEAARRGVAEELGSAAVAAAAAAAAPEQQQPSNQLVSLGLSSHVVQLSPVRDAASYPGLPTRYRVHSCRGRLDGAAFARVLPSALRQEARGGGRGDGGSDHHASVPPLEFETVEEVPGKGVHRTRWRWVEERELGGLGDGGGGGAG